MTILENMGELAQNASYVLSTLSSEEKNNALSIVSNALIENQDLIISANMEDIKNGKAQGMKDSLIDRLFLNPDRIKGMANGLIKVKGLPDPIGEVIEGRTLPNGLQIIKKRVPMGVIGIIYESRPNVTSDAFGLCFKSGNAVILRGGKEAISSNKAIVSVIQDALSKNGYPKNSIQLVTDTSHKLATEMMRLNKYIDVLIPRGGFGLIQTVVKNSTVPVIETGIGNCHVYVDKLANLNKATNIIINAKTQRTGVCNACESLLIHKSIVCEFLPIICEKLREHSVEIRGDEEVVGIIDYASLASEEDWATEFLDLIISIKVVASIDEALSHIRKYGTKHSEAIVSEDYNAVNKFLDNVDAAAVYANASTRFTDGEEFGLGAEIGISTQKLHARGPMGLRELTTSKYIILGSGQIR